MTIKILMTCSHLYPALVGGPGLSEYWLAKGLTDAGLDIHIVTTDDGISDSGPPLDRWIKDECGSVFYAKTKFRLLPTKLVREAQRMVADADIVQVNGLWHPSAYLLARTAVKMKKKLVWNIHGCLDPAAMAYSPVRNRLVLTYIQKYLTGNTVFRSTCPRETAYIKEAFGKNSRILELPIFMFFPPIEQRAPTAEKRLLSLGRIHPIKAIDHLVEALSLSKQFMGSNANLYIAGNPATEYARKLQNLVAELGLSERVKFVGHVADDEKERLLADSYWAFLPSHTENMGVVVMEAMAQGTPYTTSTGTPWNVLNEKELGYCIDNSPSSLAENLDTILSMPDSDYNVLRERCIEFARKEFDMRENVSKWTNFYDSLLNDAGS